MGFKDCFFFSFHYQNKMPLRPFVQLRSMSSRPISMPKSCHRSSVNLIQAPMFQKTQKEPYLRSFAFKSQHKPSPLGSKPISPYNSPTVAPGCQKFGFHRLFKSPSNSPLWSKRSFVLEIPHQSLKQKIIEAQKITIYTQPSGVTITNPQRQKNRPLKQGRAKVKRFLIFLLQTIFQTVFLYFNVFNCHQL